METKVLEKVWKILPNDFKVNEHADSSVNPIIASLLWQRGIRTEDEIRKFFEFNYERDIHDPFLFNQMNNAVDRIFQAIEKEEQITIHGDYDADGVTGSALLMSVLRDISSLMGKSKEKINFYIPHREKEGYGLHNATVDFLRESGTNLIITVDCGIACAESIAKAKDFGIDTIVVDHHEFSDKLPEAILIHPRLPGESYPFPYLAAVGVSWKVACALYARARQIGLAVKDGAEKWLLDLVSIATVTDMVPLVGENRVLEHFGLKVLKKTKRLGLKKLFEVARVNIEKIDTHTVGFQIGPRINAAGRMEHAESAFELLVAEEEIYAEAYAQKLNGQNILRQQESAKMYEEAYRQIESKNQARLLWAHSDSWSPGLVGLVAGKLVQEFSKPVLIMGKVGERMVGSGRSVPGFHITDALREVADCLERFGGHPQACGFTAFADERFSRFLLRIEQIAEEKLFNTDLAPAIFIDAELVLNEINYNLVDQLDKFGPYGEGNPMPKFATYNLLVAQVDPVGENGKHLRLLLRSADGISQKFIGFGIGGKINEIVSAKSVDVIYELGFNEWNGRKDIQCKIVDLKIN